MRKSHENSSIYSVEALNFLGCHFPHAAGAKRKTDKTIELQHNEGLVIRLPSALPEHPASNIDLPTDFNGG